MSRTRFVITLTAMTVGLLAIGWLTASALPLSPSGQEKPDGEEQVYFVEGEVTKPVKIEAPAPTYTELGRKEGTQGTVIVQTTIDGEGRVTDIEVLKELENGLTEQAVSAIEQWRFEPATLDGKPVSVYYNLTVNFRLADKKEQEGAE